MGAAFTQPTSNQIRLVKVTQEVSGNPGSFPTSPNRQVYKCMPATLKHDKVEGGYVTIVDTVDTDRAIYVANFRNNLPVLGNYYLVFQLSPGVYVFDNQMAFLENQ